MIERKYFGETQNGDIVSKFLLENKSGMQVEVSDLGALILAISIIDKEGIKGMLLLDLKKWKTTLIQKPEWERMLEEMLIELKVHA